MGSDQLRIPTTVPEFGAEQFHMRVDRAFHRRVGFVPGVVHQLGPTENLTGVGDEHSEQPKLGNSNRPEPRQT